MVTYGIFEFGTPIGMLLGDLSHNGIGNRVASADDHVDVCRVEEFCKSILRDM